MDMDQHPLYKWDGNVRNVNPKGDFTMRNMIKKIIDLKPIELYPWNIISGSTSAFIARTVTYPLDTIRYNINKR